MLKRVIILFLIVFFSVNFVLAFGPGEGGGDTVTTCDANNANYCDNEADCNAQNFQWVGLSRNQEGDCTDPNNNCCIPRGVINCGATVSNSIALTSDITCDGSLNDAMIIGANNIKIDCRGHEISGSTRNRGIQIQGKSNVVLQNCEIDLTSSLVSSTVGVNVYTSSDIIIEDLKVRRHGNQLNLLGTTNSVIDGGEYRTCNGAGITSSIILQGGSSGNIIKNVKTYGCHRGLGISSSNDNIITGNDLSSISLDNGGHGLYLYPGTPSTGNLVYDNIIKNLRSIIPSNFYNSTYNCTAGPNVVGGSCIGGNFWTTKYEANDYTGPDADKDGVGDSSFTISSGISDSLPLVPCRHDCLREGMKECVPEDGGSSYRTCGYHDSDTCLDWSDPVSCPTGTCSGGVCNYDPNNIEVVPFKACCGNNVYPYTSFIHVCAVPKPGQENNCPNVHTKSSLDTYWMFASEVKNSTPVILCDTGGLTKKRFEICTYDDVAACENRYTQSTNTAWEEYPNLFDHCDIVGYVPARRVVVNGQSVITDKPTGAIDYDVCRSLYTGLLYRPSGTQPSCQYNGGSRNREGYIFFAEQSANDYGAVGVVPPSVCEGYTNKSDCLANSGDECTWTPPWTDDDSEGGGCCPDGEEFQPGIGCGPTENLCFFPFSKTNIRSTQEGFGLSEANLRFDTLPSSPQYCAQVTSGLTYGFWYPTETY